MDGVFMTGHLIRHAFFGYPHAARLSRSLCGAKEQRQLELGFPSCQGQSPPATGRPAPPLTSSSELVLDGESPGK